MANSMGENILNTGWRKISEEYNYKFILLHSFTRLFCNFRESRLMCLNIYVDPDPCFS